jgi:hypothetical protein
MKSKGKVDSDHSEGVYEEKANTALRVTLGLLKHIIVNGNSITTYVLQSHSSCCE